MPFFFSFFVEWLYEIVVVSIQSIDFEITESNLCPINGVLVILCEPFYV